MFILWPAERVKIPRAGLLRIVRASLEPGPAHRAKEKQDEKLKKKGPPVGGPFQENDPGNVLLSHAVAHAVPSALRGLTTVFGMGTGVTPSLWSPGNRIVRISKCHGASDKL